MGPTASKHHEGGNESGLCLSVISGLHLITLFNLCVAQPLYSVLADTDHLPFFAAHQSSGMDIMGLLLVFSLALPLALFICVWLVNLVARRLALTLYLGLVFLLLLAFSLMVTAQYHNGSDGLSIVIPLLSAVLVTLIYTYSAHVRSVVTALSVVILIAPCLFLLSPSIQSVISKPKVAGPAELTSQSHTPDVVLIILDELPLISLIDEDRKIDSERYPNFHRLANVSTWYRNTTTTNYSTTHAITDMLIGGDHINYLKREHGDASTRLKWSDFSRTWFPSNLFSLLEKDHEVFAIEHNPRLAINTENSSEYVPTLSDRIFTLITDATIIYAHVITPKQYLWHLPIIEGHWSGFLNAETASLDDANFPYADSNEKLSKVKTFVESIKKRGAPSFYFFHALLPHFPFVYNEQGQRHSNKFRFMASAFRMAPGRNVWPDEITANLAYQAHLLQLGFTDTLLGKIIDRLEAQDLFEDALIVVTSDHGISFYWDRADTPSETLAEIQASGSMFIPLFIKQPGQKSGVISDQAMQNIDIVPTMAEILNKDIPWSVEGFSALDESPRPERTAYLGYRRHKAPDLAAQGVASNRKFELFGARTREGLYPAGPHSGLLGTQVSSFPSSVSAATVIISNQDDYKAMDPSSSELPAYVEGEIQNFPQEWSADMALAIAVNGVIRQTTLTSTIATAKITPIDVSHAMSAGSATTKGNSFPVDGQIHFLARVQPQAFSIGVNTVTVYGILEDEHGMPSSLMHFNYP